MIGSRLKLAVVGMASLVSGCTAQGAGDLLPIPDRLVVLTFDDSVKSQATFVAPILKRYGFGATFFITECPKFAESWRDQNYMTWEEIRKLH